MVAAACCCPNCHTGFFKEPPIVPVEGQYLYSGHYPIYYDSIWRCSIGLIKVLALHKNDCKSLTTGAAAAVVDDEEACICPAAGRQRRGQWRGLVALCVQNNALIHF
jgi:hypothetical protein